MKLNFEEKLARFKRIPASEKPPRKVARKLAKYIKEGRHYGLIHFMPTTPNGEVHHVWSLNVITMGFQVAILAWVLDIVTPSPGTSTNGTGYLYLNAYIGTGTGTPTTGDTALFTPYAVMTINNYGQNNYQAYYQWGGSTPAFGSEQNGSSVSVSMPSAGSTYQLATVTINLTFPATVFANAATITEFGLQVSTTSHGTAANVSAMDSTGLLFDHDMLSSAVNVTANGTLPITVTLGI